MDLESLAHLDLSDPLPRASVAAELHRLLGARIKESFLYLDGLLRDYQLELDSDFLARVQAHEGMPGQLYLLHDRLLAAIERESLVDMERCIAATRLWYSPSAPIKVTSIFDGDRPYEIDTLFYDCCDEASRATYGRFVDIHPLQPNERHESKAAMNYALNRWSEIDPDGYAEAAELVSDLVLIHSDTSNAGSSVGALGMVRVSHLKPGQRWSRYLEAVAHEAGHQYLNILFSLDPIILNDGEGLFSSPLRVEPRPLNAIFHAYFVLARTIRVDRLLRASNRYVPEMDQIATAYNNKANPVSFVGKFLDARDLLAQQAKFSDFGKTLFDRVEASVLEHEETS